MSRSNPTTTERIAQKYFEWNGDKGGFKYFDKTLADADNPKGKNVEVPLPFSFIVLDILSSIKGWSDADSSGIYSNEVKDLKKQELVVKTFKGTEIASGLYANIKDKVAAKGGKFCTSVYIGYFEGKEMVIANLQIHGASLGGWIDYGKKQSFYKGAITVKSMLEGKKGKTVYQMPVFEPKEISPASEEKAVALDALLQDYLKTYFEQNNQSNIDKEIVNAGHDAAADSRFDNFEDAPLSEADAPFESDETDFQDIPF